MYKKDADDGALEFIGEEKIDHTPRDEKLSLRIGNAFDIVGERKQTRFRIETWRKWMQETIQIKVRNHKKEDVVVRVKEPLNRWVNWRITEDSHEDVRKKLDSRTTAWDLPVKGRGDDENAKGGEVVLTYTVEYTW